MDNINKEFISCVKANDVNAVTVLLEAGADVHIYNDCALRYSARTRASDMIIALLECGANPNIDNGSILRHNIRGGHLAIVTKLLEFGANVNANNDSHYHSTLELGILYGNLSVVKVLLEHDVDLHHRDDYALQMSLNRFEFKIASILLESGANIYCNGRCILKNLQSKFNGQIADIVLPYCEASDYEYFPQDYIRSRLVPIKSANSASTKKVDQFNYL